METPQAPRNLLDKRVKTAWRLQALASLAPLLLGGVVFVAVARRVGVGTTVAALVLGGILVAILAAETFVPEVRYRRWRWEVREEEVRLQEGLIVVSQTVIPMVRVQHVDTAQGPIMRSLGLSDVHIWTAAGKHTIPALADAHAEQLRDRIAVLARVTDDGGL